MQHYLPPCIHPDKLILFYLISSFFYLPVKQGLLNDGLSHRYASHPEFTGTGALSYTSFAIPRHEREGTSVFLSLSFNPSWADPALLRFAFVTALLAFRLRGEQLPLLALPRKRAAGFPSVLPTCLSRFSGHGPYAGLAGRQQDFMYARSPTRLATP